MVDGCAILWTINWPISGTLLDLVNAVAAYVHARLMNSDVHLIFDIYLDYSTRGRRASVTADRRHHLTLQSPLPPQSVSLTDTGNKVQLIDVMCDNLPAHFQDHLCNNKLIITSPNTIPDEITMGVHVKRHDMGNRYEEADVIVVNQVMSAASQGYKTIHIVFDNTDVFVLLIHFYKTLNITSELLMVPTLLRQ